MEEFDNRDRDNRDKNEIFGKQIKAGKRSYFIDVKSTNKGDYYLVITESKKKFIEEGKFVYDKHKIFIYKEDFEKFTDTLTEAIDFIKKEQPFDSAEYAERRRLYYEERNNNNGTNPSPGNFGKDVSFEDL
jgi:hypothetical protein